MCSCWPRLRSSRCISSRGSSNPSELPIFLISIFIVAFPDRQRKKSASYICITHLGCPFNNWPPTRSAHRLQLVDHAGNDRQPAVPEFGVLGVQPERLQKLGIVLGAAGREHREVALGESVRSVL